MTPRRRGRGRWSLSVDHPLPASAPSAGKLFEIVKHVYIISPMCRSFALELKHRMQDVAMRTSIAAKFVSACVSGPAMVRFESGSRACAVRKFQSAASIEKQTHNVVNSIFTVFIYFGYD
jgi:hypothetical protein